MWHVSSIRMDFRFAIKGLRRAQKWIVVLLFYSSLPSSSPPSPPPSSSLSSSSSSSLTIIQIVPFNMEINETTTTVTWLCQLFGFAPYKFIRNNMNQIVDFKLSRAMCVYSTAIIIVFTISANYALIYDLNSGHSVRYFFIPHLCTLLFMFQNK